MMATDDTYSYRICGYMRDETLKVEEKQFVWT